MKTLNTLVNQHDFNQPQVANEQPQRRAITANDAKIMDELFIELMSIFPAWKQALTTPQQVAHAKKTWTKAMIENGITDKRRMAIGLRVARQSNSPFLPSAGQFVEWCLPKADDYGLPDERTAYLEACQNSHNVTTSKWSHPAIFYAGKQTGFFLLKTAKEDKSWPMFKRNYADAVKQVKAGQVFETPERLPPPPPAEPAKPETITTTLTRLKTLFA